MADRSFVSPDDQGATFIELFFDLVFVFAVKQLTHYAAHHLDASGILRSVVLFWLIWWGWTQFTWALNAANTHHDGVRVSTLVATGVAAVLAVSVDGAFSPGLRESLPFAVSYIALRVIGLALFLRVVFHDRAQRSAVRLFAVQSVIGLLVVLAGAFLGSPARLGFWLAAMVLDLAAGWFTGNRRPAAVHPRHFAERHGLIVIIALGESMIVAASGLSTETSPLVVGSLALVITGLLWWTYLGWVKGLLEEKFVELAPFERSLLARDAYTFGHFPLVCGIIAVAIGFEASLHPDEYTMGQAAAAMAVGLVLFLVSTAAALWRAHRCVLWNRLIICGLTVVAMAITVNTSIRLVLTVAVAGLSIIVVYEQTFARRKVALAE